jgi:hypothetical protein
MLPHHHHFYRSRNELWHSVASPRPAQYSKVVVKMRGRNVMLAYTLLFAVMQYTILAVKLTSGLLSETGIDWMEGRGKNLDAPYAKG